MMMMASSSSSSSSVEKQTSGEPVMSAPVAMRPSSTVEQAATELAALLCGGSPTKSLPDGGTVTPPSSSSPEPIGSPFLSPDMAGEVGLSPLGFGSRKGRVCDLCSRSETPMWRRGPGGKGTLCNACGVRWSLRKKRPRPGEEGGPSIESAMLDATAGTVSPDDTTDPAIAALRSRRDAERQDYYYCRYCEKTWPLNYFRNSQQFGAHCSNCSRKKRPSPGAGETDASSKTSSKRERSGREQKRAKRERKPAQSPASQQWKIEGSENPSDAKGEASGAPSATPIPRGYEGDAMRGVALSKRRGRPVDAKADSQHDDDSDDEEEAAWERLFDKLKSGSKRHHSHHLMMGAASRMSDEDRRREVELLEKEVTLLRYQVRLKEHWHKKSLKEVKHTMEEELHDLQKDLYYSFEVAQACIKLELESNEKEETQVLLAFAQQVSPQPSSPHHQQQNEDRTANPEGEGARAGAVPTNPTPAAVPSGSDTCGPCHDSLHKLRQEGEKLRRSCHLQLARLKTDLEHHFSAKEEAFLRMLHDTKMNFSASSQRLRKKIAEIEVLIRALRDSLDHDAVPTDDAEQSSPSLLRAACQ